MPRISLFHLRPWQAASLAPDALRPEGRVRVTATCSKPIRVDEGSTGQSQSKIAVPVENRCGYPPLFFTWFWVHHFCTRFDCDSQPSVRRIFVPHAPNFVSLSLSMRYGCGSKACTPGEHQNRWQSSSTPKWSHRLCPMAVCLDMIRCLLGIHTIPDINVILRILFGIHRICSSGWKPL